jgi:hypothetical protein
MSGNTLVGMSRSLVCLKAEMTERPRVEQVQQPNLRAHHPIAQDVGWRYTAPLEVPPRDVYPGEVDQALGTAAAHSRLETGKG